MRLSPAGRAVLLGSCFATLALSGLGPARTALSRDRAAGVADTCVDDLYEPDSTLERSKPLYEGSPQTHEHCDPDWVNLAALSYQAVYAIETSAIRGNADTRLRVYTCNDFTCSSQSRRYTLVAEDHGGGATSGASRVVLTNQGGFLNPAVEIVEEGEAYGPGKGYDISVRCLDGCPAAGTATVVPAVTHLRGRNGTFFRTDLTLVNPGFRNVDVELVFTTSGDAPERFRRRVSIGPDGTAVLPDLVARTFGLDGAFGWLEVRSPAEVVATARTYSVSSGGAEVGEVVPAVPFASAAGPDATLHLPSLRSGSFRTNVGFCETTGGRTKVEVGLVDAAGTLRASRTYELPPYGHRQLNDVFAELGLPDLEEARVTLHATSNGARLAGYATVIDNGTGDFSYLAAQKPTETVSVPVPAEGRTEIRIVNPESVSQEVGMRFLPDSPRGSERSVTFLVQAKGTLAIDDAVLAYGGSGLVVVTADRTYPAKRITAAAWTRRADGTGFSGFATPSTSYASRYTVPIARNAASLALFNPLPLALSITASIVDARGATRGVATYPVPAGRGVVTAELPGTAEDRAGARLDLDVAFASGGTGYGPIAYLVGTDPLSGDSTLGAARPLLGYEQVQLSLPGGWSTLLRRVPPGTTFIGSPDTERGRDPDETRHPVTLTAPFFIEQTETTVSEWQAVTTGQTPAREYASKASVSWQDVAGPGGFVDRVNAYLAKDGLPGAGLVRLPTEAEWEIAARDGTSTRFPLGDLLTCDDDGCARCPQAGFAYCGNLDGYVSTGSFPGSLWEWVQDWYAPYGPTAQTDPTGPAAGTERVIRGGGFDSPLRLCRSANRFSYPPDDRRENVGFRIVVGSPAPLPPPPVTER